MITAQQIIDRVQKNLGVPWKSPSVDVFHAGKPDSAVTGIATTWTPTLDVLRRAVAAKKNMIVTRESPYWLHETATPEFSGSGNPPNREALTKDPIYQLKREFIEKNNLVIWRFYDNWNARAGDMQMRALVAALGWEQYKKGSMFELPSGTLLQLVKSVQGRLRAKAPRVLGDPQARVSKVAVTHGFLLVPALEDVLKEAGIDVVICGEPVEWEAHPYFDDWITAGRGKGMIILGHEVSEEPGAGAVAAWMKTVISEVPVEWIPAGEPFWRAL
jgi:putative NIF3 family GTP cyclohydrolase 1 type 2